MSTRARFGVFILIFLSIIYSACLGVALFFGAAFAWSWHTIVLVSFLQFLCIPTYFVGGQSAHSTSHVFFKGFGGMAMGILSIALSISMIGGVAIFIGAPAMLMGYIGLALLIGGVSVGVFTNYRGPTVITHHISLGQKEKKLRMVQISDLHINGLKHTSWTQNLVTQVNALSADIVVFTGDLADVQSGQADVHLRILKNIQARKGKFAISGNHDFYNGYTGFQDMLDTMGFTLIDNTCIALEDLYIAGISDQDGHRFGYSRPAIAEVLAQRRETWPTILLDHRPDQFKKNVDAKVDFQLSGHTHGGQMPPWNLIVKLWYTFSAGLYAFKNSQIYISKGTGTWGPPIRLFAKSEVTFFDVQY